MSKNILIFRTDRIGDLLHTFPTIFSIKNYFKNSKLTLIASDKNYDYAKSFDVFDNIYKFPKNSIFEKIKLIKMLRRNKYDYVLILDGKDRSIISTVFLNSEKKVALTSKYNLFHKLINIKFFNDNEDNTKDDLYQKSLDYLNVNIKIGNYDFLKNKNDNNFSQEIPLDKYIHLHLDEKWFSNLYIKTYTNINPDKKDFLEFLNQITHKDNIIITTGLLDTDIIENLKNNFFEKINNKIFKKKLNDHYIYLIYKPSFFDLESLLKKSKVLIACHGGIIFAASCFNLKLIDIHEEKQVNFYRRFTSRLKNYFPIYRSDFKILKNDLIHNLKK